MAETAAPDTGWGAGWEMPAMDALMWRVEADPRLRSTMCAVEVLDRAPDWDRVFAAADWATRMVPRLRMRVIQPAFGLVAPQWVVDENFDLAYHVRRTRLPEGAGEPDLFTLAAHATMSPLDKARPPWEALVVEGLPGGKAAFLVKLHHASTDGIGATHLLNALHSRQRKRTSDKPQPSAPAPDSIGTAGAFARQAARDARGIAEVAQNLAGRVAHPREALAAGVEYAASLRRMAASHGADPSPLLAGRSLTWRFLGLDLPFQALRAAGKSVGGSVNDAYLAALLGAFTRYHEQLDAPVSAIPMAIPISVRKPGKDGGNQISFARLAGPLDVADPEARIQAIGRMVRAARDEAALEGPALFAPLLARLPGPLSAQIGGGLTMGNDLQASNVPGIQEDVFLAGAKIERVYPYAPLPGCAAMITLVSHQDLACIGANLDPAAVTEPERFAACLQAGFEEILALGPEPAQVSIRS